MMDKEAEHWKIGVWVEVVSGRKALGARGIVFWSKHVHHVYDHEDPHSYYKGWRVGFKDELGNEHYINVHHLQRIEPPLPAVRPRPAIEKGVLVRWRDGLRKGVGKVFWCGPNKYGPGMRFGLKDTANGATLWLDDRQVIPITKDGLAQLRSLLHQEPSAEVWDQIITVFEGWPQPSGATEPLSLALEYAQEHLNSWPDALRTLPRAWFMSIMDVGTPTYTIEGNPVMALMRSCISPEENVVQSVTRLKRLLHCGLSDVRLLDLRSQFIGDKGVQALVESQWAPHLRLLVLASNQLTAVGARTLAAAKTLPNLVSLNLDDNPLSAQGLGAEHGFIGFAEVSLPNLEQLVLPSSIPKPEAEAILINSGWKYAVRTQAAQHLTVEELRQAADKLELRNTRLGRPQLVQLILATVT